MDLGEKLQILQEIIYRNAEAELMNAEVPPTLRTMVIDNVAARFKEIAYKDTLLRNLQKEEPEPERHTGTPAELLKEIGKGE